jgi:hypothetical protein
LAIGALLAVVVMTSFAGAGSHRAAAAINPDCQTSFLVFTDPNNIGQITTRGNTTKAKNSGVLGEYTSGRFDGFTISGEQDLSLNQATGKATIKGSFVATSPDGQSSFTLRYRGEANLVQAIATGNFQVIGGTGDLKRFRTSGKIDADYLGNFTFSGVDIGLC